MNNRMTEKELLELLQTLKVDKEEFWILSSSALVLRGIFPDAGDLDIAVTRRGLEQLKENYNLKPKDDNRGFIVSDKIEVICVLEKENLEYQLEEADGYFVQNIKEYYNYLCTSTREKDKARIPLVEDYIKGLNN